MWLENIDNIITHLTDLAKSENKGDVIKHTKEIRDKTIIKTVTEFKKGVIFLKHRYEKNISKPFKEINDEKELSDYDKLINLYANDIEKNKEYIISIFVESVQEEVKQILTNIIEETIIETIFEFQKGIDSLEAHISKNINNQI